MFNVQPIGNVMIEELFRNICYKRRVLWLLKCFVCWPRWVFFMENREMQGVLKLSVFVDYSLRSDKR